MRRALAPVALACAFAAAGCAGGSTTTADPAGSADPSPSVASPAAPGEPAPSAPTSGPPTSSPPADSPTAAGSASAGSGSTSSPAVHTYKHLKVTLPVTDATVESAPPGLTAYLRTVLQKDWRSLGRTAECRKSGVVVLEATRADGFAYGSHEIDVTPSGGCMKAATMGGGYRAVWKSVDGTWKQILAMQDVPDCSAFEKWDVPSALLGKDAQCYDGNSVVAYQHD